MKRITRNALALSLIMTICSCNSKKVENVTVKDTIATEVQHEKDTIVNNEPKDVSKTVIGTVLEITNGKDGYTAKVETKEKELYYVTISHANLKNHEQYKTFKVGEALNITGDFWKMEDKKQITVRVIN